MPIYKHLTPTSTSTIYLWKLTESEKELRDGIQLTPACTARLLNMQSPIHRKGFLGVRQLLKHAGYFPKDLSYDSIGKPYLSDEKYISISHSFEYVCIVIASEPVGIDIEKERPKIQRIAAKFLHDSEYSNTTSDRMLTTLWCIKEAAYKLMGQKGLSFLNHIRVTQPGSENPIAIVRTDSEFAKLTNWVYHWPDYSCAMTLKINS